jgi:hypothetical protein
MGAANQKRLRNTALDNRELIIMPKAKKENNILLNIKFVKWNLIHFNIIIALS